MDRRYSLLIGRYSPIIDCEQRVRGTPLVPYTYMHA